MSTLGESVGDRLLVGVPDDTDTSSMYADDVKDKFDEEGCQTLRCGMIVPASRDSSYSALE